VAKHARHHKRADGDQDLARLDARRAKLRAYRSLIQQVVLRAAVQPIAAAPDGVGALIAVRRVPRGTSRAIGIDALGAQSASTQTSILFAVRL
jgi:hypothetical protein